MLFFTKDHILRQLNNIKDIKQENFGMLFGNIKADDKEQYREFLRYVDAVLNDSLEANPNGVNFINLHIPSNDETLKEILLQLISIKFFFLGFKNQTISETNNISFITNVSNTVDDIFRLPIKLAYDGPGTERRGKRKEIYLKRDQRKRLMAIRNFYQGLEQYDLGHNALYKPQTLINMTNKHEDYLADVFDVRKFAIPFDKISFNQNIKML